MADKYVPIFYDWIEATQELKAQEKGRLIDAIVLYARGGDWSELLEGNEKYVFPMFQLQIERAKNVSLKRTESGANGGKQAQANRSKNKQTVAKPSKTANKNKDKEEYENKNKEEGENIRAKTRFIPPTIDEIRAYCDEINYNLDVQYFFDYYQTAQWKKSDGKPVLNWKLTVQTWKKHDEERGKDTRAKRSDDPGTVELTPEEERLVAKVYEQNGRDAWM